MSGRVARPRRPTWSRKRWEPMPYTWLSERNALIFRITHIDNVRWILQHGLHCRNGKQDPDYVTIGLQDVIDLRQHHAVPVAPGGTLSDYIPFYFTPFSPMAYKIHTGHEVSQVNRQQIVVLVASLRNLADAKVPFIFSDRHAALQYAEFFDPSELARLDRIDWQSLQNRDFRYDDANPEKVDRYQAEALIHRHLPTDRLERIACWRDEEVQRVQAWANEVDADVQVKAIPRLYF